jgi:hypothetical protein
MDWKTLWEKSFSHKIDGGAFKVFDKFVQDGGKVIDIFLGIPATPARVNHFKNKPIICIKIVGNKNTIHSFVD